MNNSKKELDRIVSEYRPNPPRFQKELNRLLKEGIENNDILLIGGASYYLALNSFQQGQRTSFLPNAYKAASVLEKTSERTLYGRSLNLLGIAYVAQGNFPLALEAYNKALQTIRRYRSCRLRRDSVLSNIAECYYKMGEYRRSIGITRRCLDTVRKKTPEAYESFTIYGLNLSEYYEAVGEYDKAVEILDSVADDAKRIPQSATLSAYYSRRSVIGYLSGRPDEGAKYADLLFAAVKAGNDTYEIHPDFEKIVHEALKVSDLERARWFTELLINYQCETGHTLDRIIAGRAEGEYAVAIGDKDRALNIYAGLSELYRQRMLEEKAMQYEFQKKVHATGREVQRLLTKVRISEESAEKDPLTKLLNRTALISVANDFIHAARAKGSLLSGIFIDIDYFKQYNDTYGHAMGDEVIKQVAAACLAEESPSVKFARYGGDEFLGLVLCSKGHGVGRIAARICARVRDMGIEHIKNPNGQRVTVSVGIVNVDMSDSANTIIDVVNRADKALYHAKDAGKDAIYEYRRDGNNDAEYIKQEY